MNEAPDPTGGWEQALTECEARPDACAAPTSRRVEVSPFAEPEVTGPLPASLASRARAIVERGDELERTLTGEQDRIRTELRRLPRMPRAERRSRLDIHA